MSFLNISCVLIGFGCCLSFLNMSLALWIIIFTRWFNCCGLGSVSSMCILDCSPASAWFWLFWIDIYFDILRFCLMDISLIIIWFLIICSYYWIIPTSMNIPFHYFMKLFKFIHNTVLCTSSRINIVYNFMCLEIGFLFKVLILSWGLE